MSGDNLTLEQIRNLILDTWKVFPQIQYKSQPMEVRVHGDWATIESIDTATAPTQIDPAISDLESFRGAAITGDDHPLLVLDRQHRGRLRNGQSRA